MLLRQSAVALLLSVVTLVVLSGAGHAHERSLPARSLASLPAGHPPVHQPYFSPEGTSVVPPTFATAPRSYGEAFGPNYFERSSYAGPAQRGRAYNVRRRTNS